MAYKNNLVTMILVVVSLVLISNGSSAENRTNNELKEDNANPIDVIKERVSNEINNVENLSRDYDDKDTNLIEEFNYHLSDIEKEENVSYKDTIEITNIDIMYLVDDSENFDLNDRDKTIDIRKRSIEETNAVPKQNLTKYMNSTKEPCVGATEYCNMSREEYLEMMNNYIYPHTFEWVLIVTHTLVFLGGLVGNALVCVAVYRNHSMRTVTNYFIVNLAVADFMVILFCLPPTVLWDVTETWFFGAAMCKIILYFQSVSVTVSVLTLTFISVDRWYAICFPLKFKSTTGRAKLAIVVIWTISVTLNSPELVVLTTVQSVPLRFELEYLVQCEATWPLLSELIWHIIKVVFIYTVPLMLMTVAYYQIVKVLWRSEKIPGQADTAKLAPAERSQLQSRRKAAKMLAAVVIMFAVCYFPVHLLSTLRYAVDMEQTDVITCLALISHVLCYANSAINPLIYNFMSGKFRREFRRAFCCSVEMGHEHSTTLTRLTTSKKKPYELVPLDSRKYGQGKVCQTTLF